MQQSENKSFTAQDIERYHSGKMPAQEMHALEKAALDDPFLADALEGYHFTSTPVDDLHNIKERLQKKTEERKIVRLKKYTWLKVAAVLLLMAGSGWLMMKTLSTENRSVAVIPQKEYNDSTSVRKQTALDTIAPNTVVQNGQEQKIKSQNTKPIIRKRQKQIKEKAANHSDVAINLSKQNENEDREITTEKMESKSVSAPNTLARQKTNDTYTDSSSVALHNVNKFAKSGDTIKNLNVVLRPLPNTSSDEIVISRITKNKTATRKPITIIDTLEPAEGYINFNDYIAENLKSPEQLQIKPVSGEVQLSFDVDKDGNPIDITVVKSLCEKCDEEAIRLLKQGPKWKKKKNKRGKLTIKF